jgi:hypothetical protein
MRQACLYIVQMECNQPNGKQPKTDFSSIASGEIKGLLCFISYIFQKYLFSLDIITATICLTRFPSPWSIHLNKLLLKHL